MSDLDLYTNADAYDHNVSRSGLSRSVQRYARHSLDFLLALLMLIAIAPILIAAIAAVKLHDRRSPVFFKQTRYGLNGRPFTIIKLRTMVPNAEQMKSSLADLSEDKGPGFKIQKDPRITPVGSVLRKYYIDEIPQLYNVLRGEMALVGPRANSYNPSTYAPWQRRRLLVKPGITGTWQIARDKPTDFDKRCQMDIEYVQQQSLRKDIAILVATVVMLVIRPSGY
ncbi:sugar transferase [Microvirga guangxiensis]|uniref:Sugar transferase involved in LPS biosynthesis (Colanic, teichoic acid) n=1 Tax=Microvirga guangxiensis TaxID=549386 RepID=A0A1G5I6I6_9HYPH|nr:sugar transferase [Microvirga guangxiensis]SCY71574.1 Sugar transferase involved in LPS biosynthesis (colanic, teichoic acid) [Microvirga guangxiensis]